MCYGRFWLDRPVSMGADPMMLMGLSNAIRPHALGYCDCCYFAACVHTGSSSVGWKKSPIPLEVSKLEVHNCDAAPILSSNT